MEVPILKQGEVLIATFQAALSDADLNQLRSGLVRQVVKFRSRGVIVDVTAMDVMDSFASRTLREIAQMIRLRGAETVIVGIQPEVAFAMVQLGLTGKGHITLKGIQNSSHVGILVVASDHGPGIPDIPQALRDGFSTSGSLGLGLPGVRRLMDEFEITSQPSRGTTVAVKKWKQ